MNTPTPMQADLHVHSRHSTRPSQWFLQKIGCSESYTDPLQLYHIARRRGMTLVTITDHNRIDGALEIAHLPGTFISEEVTTYFPEDGCKVHVLAYNLTEDLHAEIQKLRANLYELVRFLRQRAVTCALAHPFYAVNDRFTPEHFEILLLLFRIFELNGDASPAANRSLENLLGGLTPFALERLADKHDLAPLWPEPWVKYLIGGSDDHSSLSIGRNYTRVHGVRSAEEFLAGIEDGRAEAVERPSSPKVLAHNLYSIAYQFYRHKLDLGGQVPQDFLLRYIDRSLRCAGDGEEEGLLARLHLLWRYRHLRKIKGSIPGPLVELLKKESARLIAEEPGLFELPRQGERMSQNFEERWFHFINTMSNRILLGFANHLTDHFSGANLFSIFHTIGSAAGFCTLLAPYFVGFAEHNAQRGLARRVEAHLHPERRTAADAAVVVFAESLSEARAEAAGGLILTCERIQRPGVKSFAPIGVFEFESFPGERLIYPPVLEMLDFCFARDLKRVVLASAGPTGLAGLFIARFLKLPVEAEFSDALPRLARAVTRDGFIEDLVWKYLVWFYNQADTVHMPSREALQDLEEKGVAAGRLKLVARSMALRVAGLQVAAL